MYSSDGDIDREGGGAEGIWGLSVLSTQLYYEFKAALKKSNFKNKGMDLMFSTVSSLLTQHLSNFVGCETGEQ